MKTEFVRTSCARLSKRCAVLADLAGEWCDVMKGGVGYFRSGGFATLKPFPSVFATLTIQFPSRTDQGSMFLPNSSSPAVQPPTNCAAAQDFLKPFVRILNHAAVGFWLDGRCSNNVFLSVLCRPPDPGGAVPLQVMPHCYFLLFLALLLFALRTS